MFNCRGERGRARARTRARAKGSWDTYVSYCWGILVVAYVQHDNIGPLTCLRIGHDNTGISPSLFVEMVLVHNATTGQTYRCVGA